MAHFDCDPNYNTLLHFCQLELSHFSQPDPRRSLDTGKFLICHVAPTRLRVFTSVSQSLRTRKRVSHV